MHDRSEEAESEGYFASVSDLMVGVLFVFLLMLTMFALNFRDDSAQLDELKVRAEIAEAAATTARAQAERAEAAATMARTEAEQAEAAATTARAEAERAESAAREARVAAERELVAARTAEAEAARLRAQNVALRSRLQEAADKLRRELADREAARSSLLQRLARGLRRTADPIHPRPALGRAAAFRRGPICHQEQRAH